MTIQNIWQEYTPEAEVAGSTPAGCAIFMSAQGSINIISRLIPLYNLANH